MTHQDENHPLSFLATAFDAEKYPNISVSFGQNRKGDPAAWVKQARPANAGTSSRPDVFHTVSQSPLGIYVLNVNVAGENYPCLPIPALFDDPDTVVRKVKDFTLAF